jgi:hypothetical protein
MRAQQQGFSAGEAAILFADAGEDLFDLCVLTRSRACHQRFTSSPYRRAQSRRVIAQDARWDSVQDGLTAPSKVHPGVLQARPQGAPGAPLGAPWDITGAPGEVQRRTLARPGPTPAGHGRTPKAQGAPGAPLGAPWASPGIAQAHPNEGACAKARLGWARAHTASPRPVPACRSI